MDHGYGAFTGFSVHSSGLSEQGKGLSYDVGAEYFSGKALECCSLLVKNTLLDNNKEKGSLQQNLKEINMLVC